jgi:hypothetical protein
MGIYNVLSLLSRALAIAAIVMITLLLPVGPASAEYRILTGLSVSEEYNDNIFLSPRDREFDYITRVVPSLGITYKAPLWDWDASYAYDYRYYGRAAFRQDETHRASLTNFTRIGQDLLFLAVRDTYSRVSLDITRDFTKQSLFVNQSDQNFLSANPYVTLHSGDRTYLNVGYVYQNIWYKDPKGIDKVDHITYAEMVHALSSQLTMTITARYTQDTNRIQDYNKSDLTAGMRYEYLDGSILFGSIGNIWLRTAKGESETQLFWDAGFMHQFPKFKFNFDTSLSYAEDPTRPQRRKDRYAASIMREVERTSLGITGSLEEYRNALTKHLEATSYTVSGSISHSISAQSKVFAELTIQRLENNVLDIYTDLYLSGVRYEYLAGENLTLALEYRYTNSYSPDIFTVQDYYAKDYYNNRFLVEVKKAF